MKSRRIEIAVLLLALLAGCGSLPEQALSASDAPDGPRIVTAFKDADSYAQALRAWRTPEDVNAWIGAKFRYDMSRAMELSETRRAKAGASSILPAHDFFAAPAGTCVDLSRFAVETLREIDPALKPGYLMIEFAPVSIQGNVLRLHWLAYFVRDGQHFFFADSKRPGHIAGPYASSEEFLQDYAAWRQRQVVAFRELDSFQRKQRTLAARQSREDRSLSPPSSPSP